MPGSEKNAVTTGGDRAAPASRAKRTPVAGPDFICVGLAKTGTRWLYEQTSTHPDFWMPPIKEIGYLHRPVPKMPLAVSQSRKKRDPNGRGSIFLANAAALARQPADLIRYRQLFHVKGEQMSGDISPVYALMTEAQIAAAAQTLPKVKIILLLRDPVARAWSHVNMKLREKTIDGKVLSDPALLRDYVKTQRIAEHSGPRIFSRWKSTAPDIAFQHYFYDDLEQRPDWLRNEILLYLEADPEKPGKYPANFNSKSGAQKADLPAPMREVLVDLLAHDLHVGAEMFGGHARSWAERYGV